MRVGIVQLVVFRMARPSEHTDRQKHSSGTVRSCVAKIRLVARLYTAACAMGERPKNGTNNFVVVYARGPLRAPLLKARQNDLCRSGEMNVFLTKNVWVHSDKRLPFGVSLT